MITLDKIKERAAKQVRHEMNKAGVINELLRINLEFLIVDAYLQGQIDRIDEGRTMLYVSTVTNKHDQKQIKKERAVMSAAKKASKHV